MLASSQIVPFYSGSITATGSAPHSDSQRYSPFHFVFPCPRLYSTPNSFTGIRHVSQLIYGNSNSPMVCITIVLRYYFNERLILIDSRHPGIHTRERPLQDLLCNAGDTGTIRFSETDKYSLLYRLQLDTGVKICREYYGEISAIWHRQA